MGGKEEGVCDWYNGHSWNHPVGSRISSDRMVEAKSTSDET